MKIAIGTDERRPVTDTVLQQLTELGHTPIPFGPMKKEPATWTAVAQQVAEAVANGQADEGILFCWTGTGVSIAANKVPGIRAALCFDAETARGARLWNNANILCISMRLTTDIVAKEILDKWFATTYEPNDEDNACLAELHSIERKYRKI